MVGTGVFFQINAPVPHPKPPRNYRQKIKRTGRSFYISKKVNFSILLPVKADYLEK